jgi:hypothetical protein
MSSNSELCFCIHSSAVRPVSCSASVSIWRLAATPMTKPATVTGDVQRGLDVEAELVTVRIVHSVWAMPLGTSIGRLSDITLASQVWRWHSPHWSRASASNWARQPGGRRVG